MAIQVGTRIKAELLKSVIDQVTGGNTVLEEREDSIKINLSPDQKQWMMNFLDAQLEMKTRPDIEIDALGIILPVLWKRIWPYLAFAGGGIVAFALSHKRARRRP